MTKFIILTHKDSGKKVYVNPAAIQLIHESLLTGQLSSEKHNSTIVSFYGGKYSYIEVSESPESIMNLIRFTEGDNVQKTGHWIKVDDMVISGYCSVCGWQSIPYESNVFGMPYCPNCGERMEEVKQ